MAEHCYYNAHQQKTKENGRHDKDMTKPSSNMGIGPGLVSRLIGYLVPHGPLYKAAHTYSQSQLWIAKAYFFIGSVHNRSNHPKITACIIVPPVFKKEKKKKPFQCSSKFHFQLKGFSKNCTNPVRPGATDQLMLLKHCNGMSVLHMQGHTRNTRLYWHRHAYCMDEMNTRP